MAQQRISTVTLCTFFQQRDLACVYNKACACTHKAMTLWACCKTQRPVLKNNRAALPVKHKLSPKACGSRATFTLVTTATVLRCSFPQQHCKLRPVELHACGWCHKSCCCHKGDEEGAAQVGRTHRPCTVCVVVNVLIRRTLGATGGGGLWCS